MRSDNDVAPAKINDAREAPRFLVVTVILIEPFFDSLMEQTF
jgi:hypothetical protein